MLSMTKQLEEALMKERTPVYSGFFDGSLPEPRFGTDKGHRGFTTTSKQNRKTALGGNVEFRKNGKTSEPSAQQVPLSDDTDAAPRGRASIQG